MLTQQEKREFIDRAKVAETLGSKIRFKNPKDFVTGIDQFLWTHYSFDTESEQMSIEEVICPEEYSTYIKARESFLMEHPEFRNGVNRFWEFDEAVLNWGLSSYSEGMRHGAAFEHARNAVVGETVVCRDCRGLGITKAFDDADFNPVEGPAVCGTCHGNGTVSPHF